MRGAVRGLEGLDMIPAPAMTPEMLAIAARVIGREKDAPLLAEMLGIDAALFIHVTREGNAI